MSLQAITKSNRINAKDIRQERLSHWLTQADLAELAGVSATVVKRIEHGKPVKVGNYFAVCDALQCCPLAFIACKT